MTPEVVFAFIAMPIIVGAIGVTAFALFIRQDNAELRARAKAEQSKG